MVLGSLKDGRIHASSFASREEDDDRTYWYIIKKDFVLVVVKLSKSFDSSAMDEAQFFLGTRIDRDRENRTIHISQINYVYKMLTRFKVAANSCKYPMRSDLQLEKETEDDQKAARHLPFCELVGSLTYPSCTTRPDIMYAVAKLARYFFLLRT